VSAKNQIVEGRSIFHNGEFLRTGDEEKLKGLKLDDKQLQRLADEGTITGFGTKAPESPDPEADATLRAREPMEYEHQQGHVPSPGAPDGHEALGGGKSSKKSDK
jgi:hypothetical protein